VKERHAKSTKARLAPGATALANAARAVASVVTHGRSAEDALAPFEQSDDRPAIRAIALGTLRWYLRLAPAVDTFLERPQALPAELRALLIASAHQVEYSRSAPQLTVHLAVDAARALRHDRKAGLVNAILRRFVAERSALLERLDANLAVRTAHPAWLVDQVRKEWSERADDVLAANNAHPPMVLRVDRTRTDVPAYLAELANAGFGAQALEWLATAVKLDTPVPVTALPGFREGRVSVQDAGAQLAAPLLDARPGMRVLDACAAPGGKTGHLLEHTADIGELVAIDIDAERLKRVQENLDRLERKAILKVADVRDAAAFADGRPFERILLDAPCSSTGVIRRHPDIKLLRRRADIAALAATQLDILRHAFALLAPGGRLVYSTCSVLSAENQDVIGAFLETEPQARPAAMPRAADLAPRAVDCAFGVQLLPGAPADTDGFYFSCLEKATAGN
jgi:16S rRNA (cytosine967-C5)-methyltransferase